jgi:2-polyprenyl-3-methyl-5-hydroxy-6-metoxy-1,4-benzoquinol methylase
MNRAGWDQRANAHFGSSFYDVEGFVAGQTSLREIELAELENVSGKALLHLQCHFGLDTLSWVRKGASCTGVDISPVAIEKGRQLAARTGLEAKLVCSDVYSFRSGRSEPYDIVFTSYGAVCWLPDLHRWADIVASSLAVGGVFYMVEFHP